jgi:hypothetical protein
MTKVGGLSFPHALPAGVSAHHTALKPGKDLWRAPVPHARPEQESRKRRLLRLMLLQIAILSVANGCTGGRHDAFKEGPPAQPAPRHRYVEARFIPTDLTESLDRMSERGADSRNAIFPLGLTSHTNGEDAFVEHTATSRLDSGRLVVETAP